MTSQVLLVLKNGKNFPWSTGTIESSLITIQKFVLDLQSLKKSLFFYYVIYSEFNLHQLQKIQIAFVHPNQPV